MIDQLTFEARQNAMLARLAERAREDLAVLRSMPYAEYLRTEHWQMQRRLAVRRAGGRCQLCNAADRLLEVHHRTYERLGRELPEDLTTLCDRCHGKHHEELPTPPKEVNL